MINIIQSANDCIAKIIKDYQVQVIEIKSNCLLFEISLLVYLLLSRDSDL